VTAITSHRPLKDCTPPIARNQIQARASWESAFQTIVYFGTESSALGGDRVEFIPCQDFPQIKALVACAAKLPGWSALINSDIVVGENLTEVEKQLFLYTSSKIDIKKSALNYYSLEPGEECYQYLILGREPIEAVFDANDNLKTIFCSYE